MIFDCDRKVPKENCILRVSDSFAKMKLKISWKKFFKINCSDGITEAAVVHLEKGKINTRECRCTFTPMSKKK